MRLWKVWWLGGVPVVALLVSLSLLAESTWQAGSPALADLTGVFRLAVYWLWLVTAWKCSRNVGYWLWTPLARMTLAAGLVVTALT